MYHRANKRRPGAVAVAVMALVDRVVARRPLKWFVGGVLYYFRKLHQIFEKVIQTHLVQFIHAIYLII